MPKVTVESVRNAILSFLYFDGAGDKEYARFLREIDSPPNDQWDLEIEPTKMMYRMFLRFILLAEKRPIEELRPSHESIKNQVNFFLDHSAEFRTNNINLVKLEGPEGRTMEALFFIYAFFRNYQETQLCFASYEGPALEECTIGNLREVHQECYDASDLRPFWKENQNNPCKAVKHDQGSGCINFLLMLYLSALRFYFDVSDEKDLLEDPTMQEIFRMSNAVVPVIPYDDDENLGDLAKQGSLEPLVIFEIISVLLCVLRAENHNQSGCGCCPS